MESYDTSSENGDENIHEIRKEMETLVSWLSLILTNKKKKIIKLCSMVAFSFTLVFFFLDNV